MGIIIYIRFRGRDRETEFHPFKTIDYIRIGMNIHYLFIVSEC